MKAIASKAMVVAIAALFGLGGCVAQQPKVNFDDAAAVTQAVDVKRDDFKKSTTYRGPYIQGKQSDTVYLRATKFDINNSVLYQIYAVDFYYGDWRFLDNTYDVDGNALKTLVIDRKVHSCAGGSCLKGEHVGVEVTRDYLEKNIAQGIRIKISGKGGEEIFSIPGPYVKGFLEAMK